MEIEGSPGFSPPLTFLAVSPNLPMAKLPEKSTGNRNSETVVCRRMDNESQ